MVRAPDRTRLYDLLVTRFHNGIRQRATFRARDLIQEGRDAQIEFFAPPPSLPRHTSTVVSRAIYILQYCDTPLPAEVLAAGIDCTEEEVGESLSQYLDDGVLREDGGCWKVREIRPFVVQDNGLRLIAKALRQLWSLSGLTEGARPDGGKCQTPLGSPSCANPRTLN